MAQERKASVGTQGTLRDILTVLEKKIRNLEKRKTRLEQVEKDIAMGKEVVETQRIALSKKDQVLDMLEVCRDFLQTAEQLAKNDEVAARSKAKKEQRETNQRIIDTLGNVLRLQFLLGEALRREESEDNNEALEALRQSVDEASAKDFGKVAELWMNVLEAKPKELAPGVTFEAVHTKLSSMGELLAKLSEVSLCSDVPGASNEDEQHGGTRNESPVSGEGIAQDSKAVLTDAEDGQHSDGASTMHHVGDQQLPLEPVDASVGPAANTVAQQLTDQQVVSTHHSGAPVSTVHHHPAAVINPQGGHPPSHPAVHQPPAQGHHPGHGGIVNVIPGLGVVPVSPVQQSQEGESSDTIQFGSVENPLPVQPQHHINEAPFCGGESSRSVATAPDPDAMFEDREFVFFQDDLLHPPAPPATAVTAAQTVPAPLMLHPDPAVVHVQTGTSGGAPSLVPTHASFNAHYQQLLQMQPHLGPQQQQVQPQHQQQSHVHPKGGDGFLQQQQQQTPHETEDSQVQKQSSAERQKVDGQSQIGQQHQQAAMHGPNNGHHHHHRHERRSPRDNTRGEHDGQSQQQQQHKTNAYYRTMNGGSNQGGHKSHYGDSTGRTSWSDNRRREDNGNNNTTRGGNTWNNRNDRGGYNNGPRHHGNNGGGYGNRGGGVMGRREQTAQRV